MVVRQAAEIKPGRDISQAGLIGHFDVHDIHGFVAHHLAGDGIGHDHIIGGDDGLIVYGACRERTYGLASYVCSTASFSPKGKWPDRKAAATADLSERS
jgi:hypothetical protein